MPAQKLIITGPLWKIMNCENHILGMSKHYQDLLAFLNSKLLSGMPQVFSKVHFFVIHC